MNREVVPKLNNRHKGIVAIVVSAFGFALMAACVRLCDDYGEYVPCFEKGFFRNLVAFVISAIVYFRALGRRRGAESAAVSPRTRFRFPLALVLRCVLGTCGIFANFYALSHVPIADGQTLNKTAPFWTLLFAWMFIGEKVTLRQFSAVLIAFAGAALVVKPGFAGASAFPLAMGLLGGVCAGGAYAAVRALGRSGMNPSLIVLSFSAFSCIVSVPLAALNHVSLTLVQVLILIGAGAGAAIGQYGITLAYRFAAPREIAVFDYSSILFTAVFGYLLFGQVSDAYSVLGMTVIVAAAVLLNLGRREG